MSALDQQTLTPQQARQLADQRKTVAQSRQFAAGEELALRYSQIGLPFISDHAAYLTTYLRSPNAFSLRKLRSLAAEIDQGSLEDDRRWVVTIGVSLELWSRWCRENNVPLDPNLFADEAGLSAVLQNNHPPYALTGGDIFFQVQSREVEKVRARTEWVIERMGDAIDASKTELTVGDSLHGGRIYGGRLLHGIIGSVDPVCFSARALIGDERPQHKGGCFCLTQRFRHDWQQLYGMPDNELENLIGRDHDGNMILSDDDRCHVKVARANDEDGLNYRLVGQSQPYRTPESPEQWGPGREDGVYQLSYAKSIVAFTRVLQNMIGDNPPHIKSRHFQISHADAGNYWYVPSAPELGLAAPRTTLTVLMNEFFDVRSKNGRMFYNSKDYLYAMGNRAIVLDPPLTDRVIELLGYMFSRWHDTWYRRRPTPELGELKQYEDGALLDGLSVAERKGLAVKRTLQLLSSDPDGKAFDTFRVHPKELIVGVVPDFTLGSGFEAMRYLTESEQAEAFLLRLNEAGAAGHNVPNYGHLLEKGLGGLLEEVRGLEVKATDRDARSFYRSVILALEGVQVYLRNYAALARRILAGMKHGSPADRANLHAIAERMERLATEAPKSFLDAAQLVFSMHCAMHIAAESVSLGRLDQLLAPYYAPVAITPEQAQEIIDCFWIKMDEKVLLNHRHFSDRLSRGSGAITYQGGDFPQGAALNQWVQQVTVGGYRADGADTPQDACNEVTRMCLRAARRLPLNAPCLSLRVHAKTPDDVIREAAECALSGGGHPFLINDDKIIAGLLCSSVVEPTGPPTVTVADARDMVCDGCFESIFAGKCEFAFSYVPVPDAVEMALNRGRTYGMAGEVHLTGMKASFRTEPPEAIRNWDQFYGIFLKHYRYKLIDFYDGMLSRYGNLSKVCPSPLLSSLIDGCLERGRDLTAGGAKYKVLAPLMNGIVTAIDALWAIRSMVFTDEAIFTLPDLARCLICDWGYDMKEPFVSQALGADRIAVLAERYKNLRRYALGLPKFGSGNDAVDQFGRQLMRDLVELSYHLIRDPASPVAGKLRDLRARFGTAEHPFDFVLTPGVATFEDYAGVGSFLGASADGRRNGQTVPSDGSPTPAPNDLPVPERGRDAIAALRAWAGDADGDPFGLGVSNGAPVDINIRESFPLEELVGLIRGFARGEIGSNMMSISCADPATLIEAQRHPEQYDLVRMRMGGWSEFFVAMFPQHQEHHKRRPIFEAK